MPSGFMQNHAGTKKHVQEDKRNKGPPIESRVSKIVSVNGNSPGRILLLLLTSRHL
jgi:hypothetical protein